MTGNIRPVQGFVLLQFKPKDDSLIVMPNDGRRPDTDVIVLEIGPDVPEALGITKGSVVFLRSDAKIFGLNDEQKIGIVPFQMIMAVVEDALKLPTDEEINRVASGN